MREVATPILSPIAAHTPKAFHSIKFLISVNWLFIALSRKSSKHRLFQQYMNKFCAKFYNTQKKESLQLNTAGFYNSVA